MEEHPASNGQSNGHLDATQAQGEKVWSKRYPWPTLDPAAYHGLAGAIATYEMPETEADPAAVLFTLLVALGNIIGNGVYAQVKDDIHSARLNVAIVGETLTGAKGTSWSTVAPYLRGVDPIWLRDRVTNGFGSGEAIVTFLAPPATEEGETPTPTDPRLLIFDEEFQRVLIVGKRDNSTLSGNIRAAFDGRPLRKLLSKKSDSMVATDHHVGVLAHITPTDLLKGLSGQEIRNGFANRFLYCGSKASKCLPGGGNSDPAEIARYVRELRAVTVERQDRVRLYRHPHDEEGETGALWDELYHAEYDHPSRKGLVADLTARWKAIGLRLCVAYAALDGDRHINADHLRAAYAVWRYSVASVEYTFGLTVGDAVGTKLLEALRRVHPAGLTRRGQSDALGRNVPATTLDLERAELEKLGLIRSQDTDDATGRPGRISFALTAEEQAAR
jgi:hypothetical protein